jgi:hypothetical protein
MANVGVRSPYFWYKASASGTSVMLDIRIDGVSRYTILKNATTDGYVTYEISELIRDYISFTYTGVNLAASALSVEVDLYYTTYTGQDGTGTATGPTLDTSFDAFDGYAYYTDEDSVFTYPTTAPLLSSYIIWAPEDTAGFFYYTSAGTASRYDYLTTDTSVTVAGEDITIKRYQCDRFNEVKVVFVNRYGVLQQLYFFAKTIEALTTKKDTFKSSAVTVTGSYTYENHQIKTFDANGITRYTLNTGYISEDYNEFIKELMLSEQVWAHIDGTVYPVNVVSTNSTFKTSLNDKLVDYRIEIEQANDLISTMR